MQKHLFFISLFVILFKPSFGQDSIVDECYGIKYLDFFGLNNLDAVKWPPSEISGLLQIDFDEEFGDTQMRTNFLIPMIVKQLKEYHPRCSNTIDTVYLDQLIELYFKIREINIADTHHKSRSSTIDFIREDFYSQIDNIKALPKMIMTFDDGPFYAEDFPVLDKLKPIDERQAGFGSLKISEFNDKVILTGINHQEEVIFQKHMTGLAGRYLTELHFDENPIQHNSVATIAHLNAEGESLTLFLKNNGDFMFYFHSW